MDKGIRFNTNRKFVELLPQREAMGNTAFRKEVMFYAMEQFGVSLQSAATHYNHAFIEVKKLNPELVVGLGRPEDKKGGRKRKVQIAVADGATVLQDFVDAESIVPLEFSVYKKADSELLASGLDFDTAQAMVNKGRNAKGHYCKMYWLA